MNEILTAVIPVVIIGIICAAVLVIASKLMAVKEDKRFFEMAVTAMQRHSAKSPVQRQIFVFRAESRSQSR